MPMTLAGNDFCNIKANVKVASTENGIIFGNIGKVHYIQIGLLLIWHLVLLVMLILVTHNLVVFGIWKAKAQTPVQTTSQTS